MNMLTILVLFLGRVPDTGHLVVLVHAGLHVGVITQRLLVVGVPLTERQRKVVLRDRTRDVGSRVQLLRSWCIDVLNTFILIPARRNPVHTDVRRKHLDFACHSGILLIYPRRRYIPRTPKTLILPPTYPQVGG